MDLHREVVRHRHKDCESLELFLASFIEGFSKLEGMDEESFQDIFPDFKFTTRDTAGKIVELVPGGREIDLTCQNMKEYAALVFQTRLSEGKEIYTWIRKGMSAVVPLNTLNLFI